MDIARTSGESDENDRAIQRSCFDGRVLMRGVLLPRSECGFELEAMGRLDTAVRRQLMAVELGHPDAVRKAAAEDWKPRPR